MLATMYLLPSAGCRSEAAMHCSYAQKFALLAWKSDHNKSQGPLRYCRPASVAMGIGACLAHDEVDEEKELL